MLELEYLDNNLSYFFHILKNIKENFAKKGVKQERRENLISKVQ